MGSTGEMGQQLSSEGCTTAPTGETRCSPAAQPPWKTAWQVLIIKTCFTAGLQLLWGVSPREKKTGNPCRGIHKGQVRSGAVIQGMLVSRAQP